MSKMTQSDAESQDHQGELDSRKAPVWFWIVSTVALLWNLMGMLAFVMQIMSSPEAMSEDPAMQEMLKSLPAWYYVVFGFAVVFGTLGCVGLLLRAKWALLAFVISILGVLAQQFYMYFLSDTLEVVGATGMIFPTIVLLTGVALIAFSLQSQNKGWLR